MCDRGVVGVTGCRVSGADLRLPAPRRAGRRNPAAHEPKLYWTMSELDALDVLGTLSMIHRRLDTAISRNGEGT